MSQNKEQKVIEELLLYLKDETQVPGVRLPSERSLSDKFEASRSTLRSALKTLQANGVLEVKAGSGYYLKTKSNLEVLLNSSHPDNKKQISESLEAFYLFEPLAVALAAERMDDEALKSLEHCIVDLSKAILIPNVDKIVENHKTFHQIIIAATGNDFIGKTLQRFEFTYVLISNMISRASIDERNLIFALHVNLFKAIKEKIPVQAKIASQEMIMSTSVLLAQYEGIKLPKIISENYYVSSQLKS